MEHFRKWESSLQNTITYLTLKNFFDSISNIPYAIIKGEPLSILAYGEEGHRVSHDIDLLVSKANLPLVEKELSRYDFRDTLSFSCDHKTVRSRRIFCLVASHQIIPYRNSLGTVFVDFNHDIFWGEYSGKRVDIDEFLLDTYEMNIHGCLVKVLSPIKALIQLILHQYKDMNSIFILATRDSIKIDSFKDVYYLLTNNLHSISLEDLYSICAKLGIIPYVFYVLYYTEQIYKDEVLKKYVETFRTPEGEYLLDCYGLCEKERKRWKVDFQTRLNSKCLYDLISDDLCESDKDKISINKQIFLRGSL